MFALDVVVEAGIRVSMNHMYMNIKEQSIDYTFTDSEATGNEKENEQYSNCCTHC